MCDTSTCTDALKRFVDCCVKGLPKYLIKGGRGRHVHGNCGRDKASTPAFDKEGKMRSAFKCSATDELHARDFTQMF